MLVALSSAVKFLKSIFSVWNFVQSLKLYNKTISVRRYESLEIRLFFTVNWVAYTVAPRYNESPVITINIWKPGRITVKYVETNPA